MPLLRGFLSEGLTEGFEQRVSELMGCVTAPAGKAGAPKASRKYSRKVDMILPAPTAGDVPGAFGHG